MSYRDVKGWLGKISDAIAVLGVKRTEIDDVSVSGMMCLPPTLVVTPECFVRLCGHKSWSITPTIKREGDFLRGEYRFRGILIRTCVWIDSRSKDTARDWEALNALATPTLEAKLPRISVTRPAIADNRRRIGLPAPKVVDV